MSAAPMTGDTLLLALAAEYRTCCDAIKAFDDECLGWNGTMHTYLGNRENAFEHRRAGLLEGIAAIKADGIPGAMIHLELLLMKNEEGEARDFYDEVHRDRMREAMLWSVLAVLTKLHGRSMADGLDAAPEYRDAHRTDLDGLMAEWRAVFDAAHLEYGPVRRARMRT